MTKKIFFISVALFLVLGVLYLFKDALFDNNGAREIIESEENKNDTKNKEDREQGEKITQTIARGDIPSAAFNRSGEKVLYYNNNNFLEVAPGGDFNKNIGTYPFGEINEIQWSFSRKKALVENQEGFFIYDISEGDANKLKEGVKSATWNAFGDGIIYHYVDEEQGISEIDISGTEGENWKKIIETENEKVEIKARPGGKDFLYHPVDDSISAEKEGLFLVDLVEKEREKIFDFKNGLKCKWSPNGKKILISHQKEENKNALELGYLEVETREYYSLGFPSVIDKCVWSEDNNFLYCGMLTGFSEGDSLPADWNSGKINSSDTFWRINIDTGKKERVVDFQNKEDSVDAINLMLNEGGNELYFIDRKTGIIKKVPLSGLPE
ncbi:MAG: hypothetical protein R6V40_04200 [Candidatus Moraniibacteriota bacterium]